MKTRGAEIRIVDLESESTEQLQEHLKGVDTVISAISWTYFSSQKPLIRASKEAGVKRFIPCDWGTPCTRGLAWVFDLVSFSFVVFPSQLNFMATQKATYQDLIKEIGLGYTFIDVGQWYVHSPSPLNFLRYNGF